MTREGISAIIDAVNCHGEVSERFKEPVLKTGDSSEPRVRIPSSPPTSTTIYNIISFQRDTDSSEKHSCRSTQVGDEAPLVRA